MPAVPAAPATAIAPASATPTSAATPLAPGSISGEVRLGDGRTARRAAIFLEGAGNPAGPPRERPLLSLRSAHRQLELLLATVGQSLQISNDDLTTHSVFSVSPLKPLSLGPLAAGESRTVLLDKPGVLELFCHLHDAMEAVVVIAPSGLWALSNPQGSYSLTGVPAGRYRAVAYAPELGQVALPLEVRSGERSTLHFQILPPSQPTVTTAKGKR